MSVPPLNTGEIDANKALGLHPQFWETAYVIPDVITADWLSNMLPNWRSVGQEIVNIAAAAVRTAETGEALQAS